MSIKKLVQEANETYGESKESRSHYPDAPQVRIPDWVRGLIEEAYKDGAQDGKTNEKRRLKARFTRNAGIVSQYSPWAASRIREKMFE